MRSRLQRSLPLSLLLLAGCSVLKQSDKAFVADSLAARIYYEDRYEVLCAPVGRPPACHEYKVFLDGWKHANLVADSVTTIGALPKDEKAELAALMKKARDLPRVTP